jgi:hypothetical protein
MREWLEILWKWGTLHWKAIGTIAVIGLVGRFVKWLFDTWKSWKEGSIASEQLAELRHEKAVGDMVNKIKKAKEDEQAKYPGRSIVFSIQPDRDDDPAIFHEAMRKIEIENDLKPKNKGRF